MNTSNMHEEEISLKLFVVLTRTLDTIKKKVEEDLRCLGINPTEFAVLELLYHKGDQPIQKIGERVLIASSSMTYVVDKLEKKDYVRRKPCSDDRRITFVCLTDSGKTLLDEIFPQHKKAIHEIVSGLDLNEKENMIQQLKKLGYSAAEGF